LSEGLVGGQSHQITTLESRGGVEEGIWQGQVMEAGHVKLKLKGGREV